MTSSRRTVGALLLAVLASGVAACDSDAAAPDQRGTTSAAAPGRTASPSPRASAGSSAGCRIAVAAAPTNRQPRVLYALRFELAAGAHGQADRDATLYTYPPLVPGVRVTQPATDRRDRDLEDEVLDATADRGTTLLDGTRGLSWSVTNRTGRVARYLAWAGATSSVTAWRRTCAGSPEVSGTVTLVGPIRSGVVRCGEHARPTAADARRLLIAAQRIACQQDSTEAAPFRALEGRVPEGPN